MSSEKDTVSKAMDKAEEKRALSFQDALKQPLTLQYHAPGSWLMFTFAKNRAIHFGTFTSASLSNMSPIAERLQLVWDAAAGKTNEQLREEIAQNPAINDNEEEKS